MTNEMPFPRWSVETTAGFDEEIGEVDHAIAVRVLKKLRHLATLEDPAASCKALTGPLGGLWRSRVGDWRVILDIRKGELVILEARLGGSDELVYALV